MPRHFTQRKQIIPAKDYFLAIGNEWGPTEMTLVQANSQKLINFYLDAPKHYFLELNLPS